MQIFRSSAEIPDDFGPTVVSIGNFDGVHRGHQWILSQVLQRAAELHSRSVAVTFNPHPLRVLRPERAPKLITRLDERLLLLERTGIDAVVVLPFTAALSRMTATEFATTILCDSLHAIEVHEGANFHFGHRAEAGVTELQNLGRALGFTVHIHSPLRRRGMTVSSSRVRELITAGDLSHARSLLGHAFSIRSTPATGRGIGSRLTVPTVNLAPYDELLPAFGVYITWLTIAGKRFEAVTNIGNRPTFGEDSFSIESHILNFQPLELTAETPLELTLLKRLRPEMRWPSPETLKSQILRDVAAAKRYFDLTHTLDVCPETTPG